MPVLRKYFRLLIFCSLFLVCCSTPVLATVIVAVGPETPKAKFLLCGLVVSMFSLGVVYDRLERGR